MEINYQTILEHLCSEDNNKNQTNNFPTKKNIMVSSESFPENIAEILKYSKKMFYRYGITKYDNDHNNISFICSIFTLLDKKFITLDKAEEVSYIKSYMTQVKQKVLEKDFKFELKSKFSKDILLDRIEKTNLNDGVLIQLFSQILDINFIIMDFKTDKLNSVFNGDYFNPWKVTLLLAKNDKNWEPIFCDKKQFSFNDSFLKKMLTNEEIVYLNEEYLDKAYSLLDNINQVTIYDNLSESDDDGEESPNDTFINPKNEIKEMNLNKTKLKKMKKDLVYDLLEKLGLGVTMSDNKSKMIDQLLPYI